MSVFETRLHTAEQALTRLGRTCPCGHIPAQRWDCDGCADDLIRAEALDAVASMRRALNADERFNR